MEAKELRDAVIETLEKDKSVSVAKLNGNYFSGADIAIDDGSGQPKVFRLTVIKHSQQKKFT